MEAVRLLFGHMFHKNTDDGSLKSKRNGVTDEDWNVMWNLGRQDRGWWVRFGPVCAAAVASATAWRLGVHWALCLVLAVVAFAVAFLLNFRAPNLTKLHPERKTLQHSHWLTGNMGDLLANITRWGDFLVDKFEELGPGWVVSMPNHGVNMFYRDPVTIKHIMKDRFSNYVKGYNFHRTLVQMLGHGIFNVDGQLWKKQRKVASHLFSMRFLRDHMTEVFVQHARELCKLLEGVKKDEEVDLSDLLFRFTLDAFVEIAFGVELGCVARYPEPVPFAVAFDNVQRTMNTRFFNAFWPLERMLGRGREGDLNGQLETMDEFALRIIRERRTVENLEDRPDLLSRFIANARKEQDTERMLSDEFLRDLVINFVIAGRDTTAQTLSWLFYELDQHKDVERRILEESRAVSEQHSTESCDYVALNDMTYTHAVVSETLRLHPPVPHNIRLALNDDVLPDGSKVRAGEYVSFSSYAMARSKEVWGEDAKQFNPDRFIDEQGRFINHDTFKFFSFNGGPRLCLGKPAAYLEAKAAATMLLERFEIQVTPGQELTYDCSLTLPIKGNRGGMFVTLKKR